MYENDLVVCSEAEKKLGVMVGSSVEIIKKKYESTKALGREEGYMYDVREDERQLCQMNQVQMERNIAGRWK